MLDRTSSAPSIAEDALVTRLEQLVPGVRASGIAATNVVVDIVSVKWFGANFVEITYRHDHGSTGQAVLGRDQESRVRLELRGRAHAFDGDAESWRLGAEALRIRYAALFDPMLAVASSDMDPLPHQIKAVYEELLPRSPLRFLLADDPGAGKTIMAGLYIKELLLRGASSWLLAAWWTSGRRSSTTSSPCDSSC